MIRQGIAKGKAKTVGGAKRTKSKERTLGSARKPPTQAAHGKKSATALSPRKPLENRVGGLEREIAALKRQCQDIMEKCGDPTNASAMGELKGELDRTIQMMEKKGSELSEIRRKAGGH